MTKVTKSNKGWRECSQKLMSLSPIFSMLIFSSTEFSILRISCCSDNVKVTSIKTHPRGSLCVCYSYITRSEVKFCQLGLLVPVYLCVKVNAKITKHLLSADWSYNIYIWLTPRLVIFLSVLVNQKGAGGVRDKSVILEGEGFRKMSFCTNIFIEWPLILEINNFLNF